MKILIVEDMRLEAEDIKNTVERFGHTVVGIAPDYERAVRLAEEAQPDMAILDVCLKGPKTGVDVALALQEQQIPYIFLSALSGSVQRYIEREISPVFYLLKPFGEQDLRSALECATSKEEEGETSTLPTSIQLLTVGNVMSTLSSLPPDTPVGQIIRVTSKHDIEALLAEIKITEMDGHQGELNSLGPMVVFYSK